MLAHMDNIEKSLRKQRYTHTMHVPAVFSFNSSAFEAAAFSILTLRDLSAVSSLPSLFTSSRASSRSTSACVGPQKNDIALVETSNLC